MASSMHSHMNLEEELRKQLAKAVRSIQWSYAIFWSISSSQPGVLKWVDGYYNGDIKTRKTIQANESSIDALELRRSDQLRELFNSLSSENSGQQAKRPSASLSPEDLTDTEWYYLVCMSFVYNLGQGLPGRSLASGKHIWLCNAPQADTKLFCRALLAKSASIQTVVCFPFLGGIVELGVTEKVNEDPNLIQHVQTFSLSSTPILENTVLGENLFQTEYNAIVGYGEVNVCDESSNLFMIDGLLLEPSNQVQSFLLADDSGTNDYHDSMSSSECISQNMLDAGNITSIQDNEIHYQGAISTLLETSDNLIIGSYFQEIDKGSSFTAWNKGEITGSEMVPGGASQKLLKKVLFEVARMHSDSREYEEDNNENSGNLRQELNDITDSNHVLAERRRRERISERFSVLESLVPSVSKVDKVSVLDNTIEYIRELERRVKDLDYCKVGLDTKTRSRTQCRRMANDNNESTENNQKQQKPLINKRKSCIIGEVEVETSNYDVGVSVFEKDVMIEIKCPWRESLLLEIIEELGGLQLDSHSVQSSNTDGKLSVTIQSKFKGNMIPGKGIIKQTIQRVLQKCEVSILSTREQCMMTINRQFQVLQNDS